MFKNTMDRLFPDRGWYVFRSSENGNTARGPFKNAGKAYKNASLIGTKKMARFCWQRPPVRILKPPQD